MLSLLLSLAMPLFTRALEKTKLNADAQQIASVLRLARQEAVGGGIPQTVVFYHQEGKYKIIGRPCLYLNPGISFAGSTTFVERVQGLPACAFSISGAPSSGGTVTLKSKRDKIYIIINPAAGRVRVSPYPPSNW